MHIEAAKPLAAFGFLTIVEDPQHGFFGGYLVVSPVGRPLEFHCSTPVSPSPAQRILYGATLRPYLLGEVIGATLVDEAELPVQAILTDCVEILGLSPQVPKPIVFVSPKDHSQSTTSPEPPSEQLGSYHLRVAAGGDSQSEQSIAILAPLAENVELTEPFERIREAIREAQRASSPETDRNHGSSTAA